MFTCGCRWDQLDPTCWSTCVGHHCTCSLNPSSHWTWQRVPLIDQKKVEDSFWSRATAICQICDCGRKLSWFLAAREATSHGAFSSLTPVELTASDKIKFSNKARAGVTCSPWGYMSVDGVSGRWTVSTGCGSCLTGHFFSPIILGMCTRDQQLTLTLPFGL